MNKKLKMALGRRSSEQGFAIPIAVGLGLVMLLVGMTMIIRSQGDRVTASAQKGTAQSLSVAETGITYVQAFLIKNRGLISKPYKWTDYLDSLSGNCTSLALYAEAKAFNNWITVGSGTGQFKVISYIPTTQEGILLVEGQALQNSNIKSTTRLQVRIPFDQTTMPPFNAPGAWAEGYGLGNNQIVGSVIDSGCPPGSLNPSELSQISGNVTNNPGLTLPPVQPVPPVCTVGQLYPANCGAMPLPAIESNLTLPRNIDVSNTNGEYIYYVAKSGNNSINLSGNNKLVIKPGKKVTLYLQGNINTQGSGVKIGHNCYDSSNPPDGEPDGTTPVPDECTPTNFRIYGGTDTTSIVFGGSNTVDAFISAPNAINSGVDGSAQIRGSVWLKEWDAANGNHIVIKQAGGWNNIPTLLWPPQLTPITSWQRREVL
jgi:hypothetical protein